MAKATVHLEGVASVTVTVEIPDGLDEDAALDAARDAAWRKVRGLCAECQGYGRTGYSREDVPEWVVAGELNPGWNGEPEADAIIIEN